MIGILAMFAASGGGISYALTNLTELRAAATGDVITGFRLQSTGQAQSGDGNPGISWNNTIVGQWQAPTDSIAAALNEVRAVEFSRSDPGGNAIFSGTIGSFQQLNSTRTWTLTQPQDVNIDAEWVIDITIRNIVSQATVASARITLQSEVV